MSLRRRLNAGFAALLVLFVAFLVVQLVISAGVHEGQRHEEALLDQALSENQTALQRMTDAETGVRGFQLTGERLFLAPYQNGWTTALVTLDRAVGLARDADTRALIAAERVAAQLWLDEYATPIVQGGVPDVDEATAARGKQLFDRLRVANAAAAAAIQTERRTSAAAARRNGRLLGVISMVLALAVLLAGLILVRMTQRQLLVPLDRVSTAIRRIAAGDHSARAEPAGAAELRTVIEELNDLAAQTEQLIAAEHARASRAGLRQAVAAELQEVRDPAITGRRVASLIGTALRAETVRSRLFVPGSGFLDVRWPETAPDLVPDAAAEMFAGAPGAAVTLAGGGCAITLGTDQAQDGYLYVTRPANPDWTEPEQRLLAGVAREIERVLRQVAFRVRQDMLISELRLLDQRKDVFIQTVTHELRTPLTSILGYTEILSDTDEGALSSAQHRSLTAILRNAHRLHDTIGDLLLLDRPDDGGEAVTENLDVAEIATVVHTELGAAAQAKDLTVTFDAEQSWVRGDPTQLRRALRKLMENAIKFTPPGGSVTWRVSRDERIVTVAVTDTGIGIPAEDVPGLFTPFTRAGNAMDQAVQGPGLGLAIVRDIVRDHGGAIAVQSVVGRGSTFTLTLPAVAAPIPVPAS
ncbi:ATP-binding protein [Actinoplanes sp. NPDC051851]|uniref:sensor histidine kinase n=1 Tax=Actinoplanes sp. NPDC051851 TaxID=3154753 RepID=UPI003430454B